MKKALLNPSSINIRLIFKYYWPHLKRYKRTSAINFLSYGLGVAGSTIFVPLLYKRIVDVVSLTTDPSSVSNTLIRTTLILAVGIFSYNLFYRIGDYAMSFSQSHMLKDISDDAFKRLQKHSYQFFSNTFTGSIVAKLRRYVNAFETIHDQLLFAVWMGGLNLLFSVAVLVWVSPLLAGIFFIWLTCYVGMTLLFTRKKIRKDILTAEANSKVTATLSDSITNILNVKMFASHDREATLFAETTSIEEKRRREAWYFQNAQYIFQGYFIGIFEFIGMYAAVMLWINGVISAGTIILMQIYIFASFEIVWNIGRNLTKAIRSLAEAKEMVDIFEEAPAVLDVPNPEKLAINRGHIQIKNITFKYDNHEAVFNDFSLEITPGEKVGLVGPSGAGKTTITKLLLRFADVQSGEILIDGQNIAHITQDDLRSSVSYVPQDPILFHRTLRENIAYSLPTASEDEIIKAAQNSHAHEFIKDFPHGYNTLVGERGIKLSGGERQRIAIARAMLKRAPVIILDEATSSLDSISEHHIQEALDTLMEKRTTLVIAHRLSTIQKMDRIVVLSEGKIVEEGPHRVLLAKRGLYYRLWKQQSHGFMGE